MTLRPFAKDFNTGFGHGGEAITQYGISKANTSGAVKSSASRGLGSRLADRLGGSSKGGSMGNSAMRSRNEKDRSAGGVVDLEDMRHRRDTKAPRERTESVKRLTDDVIMQTIDYKVEYEDANTEPSVGGRSSHGRDRM